MMNKVVLSQETIEEIPESPSVYALFSMDNGMEYRYVGYTHNLRESIRNHFNTNEPNVDLRYLMLSSKTKVMYYEVEQDGITDDTKKKATEWESQFQPRKILIRDTASREHISNIHLKNYRR